MRRTIPVAFIVVQTFPAILYPKMQYPVFAPILFTIFCPVIPAWSAVDDFGRAALPTPDKHKILSKKRTRKITGIFHKILQPIPRAEQTTPRCSGSFFVQFFRTLCQASDPPGNSSMILHKNKKRHVQKGIPFETHLYNNIVQRIFLKIKSGSL